MAMKNGKEADPDMGRNLVHLPAPGNLNSKDKHGKSYALLNSRNRDALHPQKSTDTHDRHKGQRNGPDGRSTNLGADYTDTEHGQQVVKAQDRMKHAGQEPGLTLKGMRLCQTRKKGNTKKGCEKYFWYALRHHSIGGLS